MNRLRLADDLTLPADEAVTQKYGFIGRSGSGKSYASMRLAELFLEHGAQIIALDWVGIWWSLRLAANGKDAGFKDVYIFGGEHADVDLRPESGALMADLVVDKHISVVLDVMHFRKAERTRFATAFAEQFFHRKKTARTACHLFIEEAQAYLPQMVRGDEARMVGVFEDIGKVGRNYGIGSSLISQRPQAINKDVLNQVEVLLAFQTNGPQERKAIAGWTAENTDAGAAMIQELPKLHVGHALAWSPQWLRVAKQIHISERVTYDASVTPTHKAKAIRPKTLDPADLAQLGEQITATIEKAKADDPRELRKRIKELEAAASRFATSNVVAKKEVKVEALTQADRDLLVKIERRLGDVLLSIGESDLYVHNIEAKITQQIQKIGAKRDVFIAQVNKVEKLLTAISRHQPTPEPQALSPEPRTPSAAPLRSAAVASTRPPVIRPDTNGSGPSPSELRMLDVIAGATPDGIDRTSLAIYSGYSVHGGGFRNTLSALNTRGLIQKRNDQRIALSTQAEAEYFPKGTPRGMTEEEVRDVWRNKLSPSEWRMMATIIAADGHGITRQDLAANCNYEVGGGGFRNTLSALSTNAIIRKVNGRIVAHEVLLG